MALSEKVKELIISQYSESGTLIAFLEALASEGDVLEQNITDTNAFRTLPLAEGANLDILGLLVGQSREVIDTERLTFFGYDPDITALSFGDLGDPGVGGRYRSADEPEFVTRLLSDAEYRAVIAAAVSRNISKCTPNEVIEAAIFAFSIINPVVPDITFVDGDTYYFIYIGTILTPEQKAFLIGLDLLPRPAGVGAYYVEYDPLDYFGFLDDPESLGFGGVTGGLGTYDQYIISLLPVAYYRLGDGSAALPMVDEVAALNGAYFGNVDLGVAGLITNDPDTALQPLLNGYGLAGSLNYRQAIIGDGPISYWRLGEALPTSPAIDEMGLQNSVYGPTNPPLPGQLGLLAGDSNTSVLFDYTALEHMFIADNVLYSFTNGASDLPFSLEAVIKVNDLTLERPIISKTDDASTPSNEWLLQVNVDGSLTMFLYTGEAVNQHKWTTTSTGLIVIGNTYFVGCSFAGTLNSGKIFINGVDIPVTYSNNGAYTGMLDTASPPYIGARFFTDATFTEFFGGFIDEVAIYDKVVTPSEFLAHYNVGSIAAPPNALTLSPPFTVALWVNFNTLSNTVLVQNNGRGGYSVETLGGKVAIFSKISYENIVLADSPLHYYRLGEGAGAVAVDEVSALNGAYAGGYTLGVAGAILSDSDTAVNFNGSTGHVGDVGSVSDFSFIQNTAIFTMECWVKIDDLGVPNTFIANTPADTLRDKGVYFAYGGSGTISLQAVRQVSGQRVFTVTTPGGTMLDNDYHHYVAMGDGFNVFIFIDGVQVATAGVQTLSAGDSSHTLNFARYNYSFGPPADYLDGDMDEIVIYDYNLTPTQILNHYNAGVDALPLVSTSGLLNDGLNHLVAFALNTVASADADSGVWVDGLLDTPAFLDTNTPNSSLYIGGEGADKTYPGVVDEVALFDKTLTPTEHIDMYTIGGQVSTYETYILNMLPIVHYRLGDGDTALPMVDLANGVDGFYSGSLNFVNSLLIGDSDKALQPLTNGYGVVGSPFNVIWENLINTTATGNELEKTSGLNSQWNSWATTQQQLTGDGSVIFTATQTGKSRAYGLGTLTIPSIPTNTIFSIVHGIYAHSSGTLYRSETASILAIGTWVSGDILEVKRTGTTIEYLKNSIVLNTSGVISTGTVHGIGVHFELNGKIEDAALGVNPVAAPPIVTGLDIAPPISIIMWVQFTEAGNTVLISNNGQDGYRVETSAGTVELYAGGALVVSTSAALNDDLPHLVIFSLDTTAGGSANSGVWVDGVLDTTAFLDTNTPGNSLYIGGEGATLTYPGIIDEVTILDRILTPQEQSDLHGIGTGLIGPSAPEVVEGGTFASVINSISD